MEGRHHQYEGDPNTEGSNGETEIQPPCRAQDYRRTTVPYTTDRNLQTDVTVTVHVGEDMGVTPFGDQDLPDMASIDLPTDLSSADVDSEFLDLPRRLSGRSSPSMIYRFSQDGQELVTGVDSCRITAPASRPKTGAASLSKLAHLPQSFVCHDLPGIEVSDVNTVDVDIIIDHLDDNSDSLPAATDPIDSTHGLIDRDDHQSGLWINLEPQSHMLLSPRSSAGSICSYRSSNDSAIDILTPDDEPPGCDPPDWEAPGDGDLTGKGAMWDTDTTTDSGNVITLWSDYNDSSHRNSYSQLSFSLAGACKAGPQKQSSWKPTAASEYQGGPFTTGTLSTFSPCDKDTAVHTPFSTTQQGPLTFTQFKGGPLVSDDFKLGPLPSSEYKAGPLVSSEDKGGPLASSEDKGGILASSEDKGGPLASSEDKRGPLASSEDKGGPLASSEDKGGPLPSSEYKRGPLPFCEPQSQDTSSSSNYQDKPCCVFTVEPLTSTNSSSMCVAPPSVVISDFSTKASLEDRGSQTGDDTQYTYLEQPDAKFHRSLSNSSVSSNDSSSTSFSIQSDSSVDVDDNLEFPLQALKKQSSWKKIRNIVHWSPFIQQFKRRQYPWIQLAGHQGNFQAGEPGAILKKYDPIEHRCFNKLMKDVLRPYVPEYRGEVAQGGDSYVQLQDLLCEFEVPCVLDVKIGRRTYLEDELVKARQKPALRKDMYEKMVEVDPAAPTEAEHQQKGITKARYMQWRDEMSSSIEHGFRIEGIRTSEGASIKNFKKTKHKDNIKETLKYFVGDSTTVLTKYLRRLKSIRATQEDSAFFGSHEVIGSSLLFVHDKTGQASIWMIDFGKTVPVTDNVRVNHRSEWCEGNHEDGYLYGLDSLVQIFTELLAASTNSSDNMTPSSTCSSENMTQASASSSENVTPASTSGGSENVTSGTNSYNCVSGSSDNVSNSVSDSNAECDSKTDSNNTIYIR